MKLDLVFPCKENLGNMPDTKNGKFCQQCSQEVIDFTAMRKEEIVQILSKKKSCGIYRPDQLDSVLRPVVHIRPQKHFIKLAVASMTFFVLSLFGCANEPKAGKAIISDKDSSQNKKDTTACKKLVGELPEPRIKPLDSGEVKEGDGKLTPPPAVGQSLILDSIELDGVIAGGMAAPLPPKKESNVFGTVQHMPSFPGGETAMIQYLKDRVTYPRQAKKDRIEGIVYIEFVVAPDGTIADSEVVRSVSKEIDAEALRVIRAMPKWQPGKNNGEPVAVSYTMPIEFSLD